MAIADGHAGLASARQAVKCSAATLDAASSSSGSSSFRSSSSKAVHGLIY
jgi:hypothetical protein